MIFREMGSVVYISECHSAQEIEVTRTLFISGQIG